MKVITSLVERKRRIFEIVFKFHVGLFFIFLTCSSFASSFHVTVDGSPNGDGSEFSPWDLRTALSHPGTVLQGDTIWLHGGTYRGVFTSKLIGSKDKPILVRQFSNQKVTIEGTKSGSGAVLTIEGSNAIYWGFTITHSETNRVSNQSGSSPSDISAREGLKVLAPNSKFINLIIHDTTGNGISFWKPAINSEVYGCIIFHNGWQGPDRGHGHGIYTQNLEGVKIIHDNIMYNGFAYGIQCYTEGGSIQGYHIEGNAAFNNGIISKGSTRKSNFLFGGYKPVDRLTFRNNYAFHNLIPVYVKNVEFGYSSNNESVICENNYIGGGSPCLMVQNWKSITLRGNTIHGPKDLVKLEVPSGVQSSSYDWDNNAYYQGEDSSPMNLLTFDKWKQTFSIDANSEYFEMPPTGTEIFVRPNKYESGRSHIIIFNWNLNNSVSIDLSDLIENGAKYEIFDIENLDQGPLLAGVYKGGSIDFPMDLTSITPPNGNVPVIPSHTGIEFGVYLILSSPYSENDTYYTRNKETDTEK